MLAGTSIGGEGTIIRGLSKKSTNVGTPGRICVPLDIFEKLTVFIEDMLGAIWENGDSNF